MVKFFTIADFDFTIGHFQLFIWSPGKVSKMLLKIVSKLFQQLQLELFIAEFNAHEKLRWKTLLKKESLNLTVFIFKMMATRLD